MVDSRIHENTKVPPTFQLVDSLIFINKLKTNQDFFSFFFLIIIGFFSFRLCRRRLGNSDGSRTCSTHRRCFIPRQLPGLNADRLRGAADQIYSHDAGGRSRFPHQGKNHITCFYLLPYQKVPSLFAIDSITKRTKRIS